MTAEQLLKPGVATFAERERVYPGEAAPKLFASSACCGATRRAASCATPTPAATFALDCARAEGLDLPGILGS